MSDHAFLAVNLSNEERHALAGALSDANPGRRLPGRKTPAENWHITLRFLGECSDVHAERIMHSLSESVDLTRTKVWCAGLGAFPKRARANVLYATVEDPDDALGRLAMWCDMAAVAAGFDSEERPFRPHLTLSRARPAVDVRHTFEAWDDFRVPIAVSAITLFRTRRSREGIRYEDVDHLNL